MVRKIIVSILFLFPILPTQAEQYPILDGRKYNGLFYPRVDFLEWGEPLHLEFQVYDKHRVVGISGETVEAGGRNVFIVAIDFEKRGERLCRRVLAPPTFEVGQKLHFYYDGTDKDMNNYIVSAQPLTKYLPYEPKFKGKCNELKAFSKRPKENPLSPNPPATRSVSSEITPPQNQEVIQPKTPDKTAKTPSPQTEAKSENNETPQFQYESIDNQFNWFN